ncbi:MAG TPA: HAD family hydrolase [Melioribacteraceae bacterium]|nr:HAD family hydrolase [Melioribacteraceae bacterium]
MIFKGYIFDIDGTITATNKLIFATFNHVADKYLNKFLTDSEIISLFGPTEDIILKDWMGHNFEQARKDYYKFYDLNHEKMASAYPGIIDIILEIKNCGLPLGIYTGKGRTSTEITLKKIGIFSYFDLIISGDDVKNHKPSPEGINKFIEKFNLLPENILMIGDAPADIIAAKTAGAKVASVLWDSYAIDTIKRLKADFYFETVNELHKFIRRQLRKVKNKL